jgi:hypothetical protein
MRIVIQSNLDLASLASCNDGAGCALRPASASDLLLICTDKSRDQANNAAFAAGRGGTDRDDAAFERT